MAFVAKPASRADPAIPECPLGTERAIMKSLSSYVPGEAWRRDHEEAMEAHEVEDGLRRGLEIFGHLTEWEAASQTAMLERGAADPEAVVELQTAAYRLWLIGSEGYLRSATAFAQAGFRFDGLAAFGAAVEEARAIVGNDELEEIIPANDLLARISRSDNPNPGRYGDGPGSR